MHSGWSKQVACERMWLGLIRSELASKDHRFDQAKWLDCSIPRGYECTPMKTMFIPSPSKSPPWLREIVGTSQRPAWFSPGPQSELQQFVDLTLAQHCVDTGDWRAPMSTFLCALVKSTNIMVKHKDFGGRCYFSLGDVCSCVGLGWPAVLRKVGGR
jgi:hypothetical protein